jgi:hypothetical protein
MKKLLYTLLVISLTIYTSAKAQDVVYEKGDNIFNAGIGLGYYGYGLVGNSTFNLPALTANYEIGFNEYVGAGPYVGYKSWRYDYSGGSYGFSILAVGVRGSFHYSTLLKEELDLDINDEKLDLYVLLNVGMEFQSYSGDLSGFSSQSQSYFRLRPALGVRYYFGPSFGAFVEGGSGALSYLTLGVSFKM